MRKLTVNAAAAGARPIPKAERIYLGPFEVYREFAVDGTTVTLQRETLSIMNGPQRIALIETRSVGTDKYPAQQIRFQYTNHIGSASLELDDQAQILTYEEFYPFGSSSYQATGGQSEVAKRYRYTGKELDGENGFYYHGARYCAPWLGRWINCDPGGTDTSGPNLYAYANGNPVIYNDPSGMEAKKHKPSHHSTHSKRDKKAAPAAPPPGPSKLDVLIDELIAILKKDIADNKKALAEAKAAVAKAAEAPKEAPDNPPALTTTTTTNGSQAMFPVEPPNKRATDIGGKATLQFAAPTHEGAEGFFNANVTGEFHQYVPLPSPKLVLSFGSLISATGGTPKDQSQFSVQGQAFLGGVLWNSKAAPGESPKAGAGGGVYFSLAAGSQGTSVNGTLAVDIGYKDPTNHFSNAVLNINGTKYVSGSGTSSLGVVAGAQLQYGRPWGVLPEVGFTHNFDAHGSWSPLAAVAFSGTGPDHGHTSVWSLELGVTANVAGGHLQSVGGFATLGYGFRLADKPADKK